MFSIIRLQDTDTPYDRSWHAQYVSYLHGNENYFRIMCPHLCTGKIQTLIMADLGTPKIPRTYTTIRIIFELCGAGKIQTFPMADIGTLRLPSTHVCAGIIQTHLMGNLGTPKMSCNETTTKLLLEICVLTYPPPGYRQFLWAISARPECLVHMVRYNVN